MSTQTASTRISPEDCTSMAQVREGVDAIDRELVALIAERARYMEAAARIKPSRAVVHDDWRIEDVIGKVLAESRRVGLSTELAEPVWRELVRQSIAYEFEVWDRTRGS
ncbi:chorismate mutase [Maricaulis salignorans]|uniref:chorismate mutase n=1 Tax=Maricaulis salignorans TaxID=144026 RepID=A0A1G9VE83_9PROT|nr:chorismate mutase [Maricaulis salignorans]SDM70391.1 isochorismate pyruvate lyase [Maricaulis salignorans]